MPTSDVDYRDVQGIVKFGFGKLTDSCFLHLKIRDAVAAKQWLASAPITNAVTLDKAPETAVQIAFTAPGLRAIGLSEELMAGFSNEFLSGLAGDESRSRRLGDVGPNAPTGWAWGGSESTTPHLILMLYSMPGELDSLRSAIHTSLFADAFHKLTCMPTADMKGYEPFGFADGISQPKVDWERTRNTNGTTVDYTNLVALGEFLLGYPNEYGKFTDRPLLPASTGAPLAAAEDNPQLLDFGRNGSYVVYRQLEQDVPAFWQFADRAAKHDPAEREKIAAAMTGRKRTGEPIVKLSAEAIKGIDPAEASLNNFTYASDKDGIGCPVGSHIRRTNPRTADMPAGSTSAFKRLLRALGFPRQDMREDVISSTRFHRLLRRGREYGTFITSEQALQTPMGGGEPRGLHFLCLNANIARQFEFIQSAWSMNANFDGLSDEVDPLLGPRCPLYGGQRTDSFSMPQSHGPRKHITGMPQFVRVRGGAYFFLPSLSALRYISQLP